MADPVKISELPALVSVSPLDILPIVDAALTQTSKATAAQIAAIGGGPPGDNTVTTAKLQNGAVTAIKTGFSATDRIIARVQAGAGNGEEIACTAFARSLLDDVDAAAARATLGALQSTDSPTFTGNVTFSGSIRNALGSQSAPSYTFTGDTDTGMFSAGANIVSLSTGGTERLRIDGNGQHWSPIVGSTTLLPDFSARAFVNIHGVTDAIRAHGNVSSVTDHGAGLYGINLTTAMPDTNYAILAASSGIYADLNETHGAVTYTSADISKTSTETLGHTTSQVRIGVIQANMAQGLEPHMLSVVIFR